MHAHVGQLMVDQLQGVPAALSGLPPLARGVALLLAALLLRSVVRRWATLDLMRIPTPWGIPVLGQLLQMALHVRNGHEQFLKWHEAYGPLVRLRLFHRDVVLVADPQVAAELLVKGPNEVPQRTPEYTAFDAAHGMPRQHAIMTEQDEQRWKAVRRAIAPAFSPAFIREVFPTIVRCYADVCRGIDSGAALQPEPAGPVAAAAVCPAASVCIDEEIFAATMRIMAEGFLRLPAAQLAQFDLHQASADVASLVMITNSFVSQPWKRWLYLGIPWLCQESRTFHAQRSRLMAFTHAAARHVEACRNSDPRDASLAACLARACEPSSGQPFSTQALQAEIFLQTVGQESIPWTLAWTLFLLTQHPEAEAAVLAELRGAGVPCCGDISAAAAALSLDSIKELPYCTAVLHEAMRLYPAGVAATPRMCRKVTRVGAFRVPAGTIVFPCLYSLLNYSGNWDSPRKFNPERWLEPACAAHPVSGVPRFVPFGIGPKACVAQHLAMVQCKVLLALLLSCFSWRLAPRMGSPTRVTSGCVAALELRVDGGMWLVPVQRTA